MFYLQSILLGIGLAMDACAVSMANGFKEPNMKMWKVILIAAFFGIFQAVMPLIGYFVGYAVLQYIERFIPWIALILLLFVGGKMLYEGIKKTVNEKKGIVEEDDTKVATLTIGAIFIQAIATSIDALSVGFSIADYTIANAIICASIIAVVTFLISFGAVFIGKKFGTKLGSKAEILGGVILIGIGIEIFVSGIFF